MSLLNAEGNVSKWVFYEEQMSGAELLRGVSVSRLRDPDQAEPD